MIRRICALVLVLLIAGSILLPCIGATAQTCSMILDKYASLLPGTSVGSIKLSYSVSGSGLMDTIGVKKIVVYRSNGTIYRTINGSVANGLIKANAYYANGDYEISCVAGTSYYCVVTAYASKNGSSDSETVQTGTVIAPVTPVQPSSTDVN